ncbi:MAG: hypothetical protein LQ346_005379 [Caloplaca aetnensis]|nr:MAG: hypothetical protein LQ346_005379 [Caloplaca aetnensis]
MRVALVENEIPGQRRINPAIIFTCKAYHHEGIKLLYANNQFAYTLSAQTETPTKGTRKDLARIAKLILRPICTTSIRIRFPSAATTVAMYWLRDSRSLKMLQVDFYGTDFDSRYQFDDKDYDSLSLLFETVDNILVARTLAGEPSNGLSELVLTGLPENDMGLSVVRAMSLLMRTDGKIGLGTGKEGARYILSSDSHGLHTEGSLQTSTTTRARRREVEPQIHWLGVEDVGHLIQRAANDKDSEWLFGDMGLVSKILSLIAAEMASGYGLNGGPSRCFPFWQEVLACYVVNTNTEDVSGAKKCVPVLEDYYECLHHKKEKARVQELQRAYRRAEASYPRENAPKPGAIRSLGLLNKDEDTEAVIAVGRSADAGKVK